MAECWRCFSATWKKETECPRCKYEIEAWAAEGMPPLMALLAAYARFDEWERQRYLSSKNRKKVA